MKRDNKDPMPMAENSARSGGGNMPYPAGAEKHGQKKGMKVSADSRLPLMNPMSPEQPTRCSGNGNTSVSQAPEKKGQKKASKISGGTERWK